MLKVGNIMVYGVSSEHELTREVLGGKGFGLIEMAKAGLNVPPAAILPCRFGAQYLEHQDLITESVDEFIVHAQEWLSLCLDDKPYLMSVRSGARISMAGMMDTVLNVGMTPDNFDMWHDRLGNSCALSCFHKLTEMYADVTAHIPRSVFEGTYSCNQLTELLCTQLQCAEYPDRMTQLKQCTLAVLDSWNNDRAVYYRKMNNIPNDWGTAVVIQAMVFGNLNEQSCTGVLFTRNPDSGEKGIKGEFLPEAQGEDVVNGSTTPKDITEMFDWGYENWIALQTGAYALEHHFKDMQDIEFTVEDGTLYFLQTRTGKRTANAAFRIACDMAVEGLITKEQLRTRITAKEVDLVARPQLRSDYTVEPTYTGIPASMGVVSARVVFTSQAAIDCKEPCILVTNETNPNDIAGMDKALGIITMKGGATSHAAVVARGMNKPCIVGLGGSTQDFIGYDKISMCGATGRIWLHEVPIEAGSYLPVREWYNHLLSDDIQVIPSSHVLSGYRFNDPLDIVLHHVELNKTAAALDTPPLYLENANFADSTFWAMFWGNETGVTIPANKPNILPMNRGLTVGVESVVKIDNFMDWAEMQGAALYTGVKPVEPKATKIYEILQDLKAKLFGDPNKQAKLHVTESQLLSFLLSPKYFDKQDQTVL